MSKTKLRFLTIILKTNLKNSGIGKIVEPMVWVYIEDIDRYNKNVFLLIFGIYMVYIDIIIQPLFRFVDSLTWRTYAELFNGVWTASAFKVCKLLNLL